MYSVYFTPNNSELIIEEKESESIKILRAIFHTEIEDSLSSLSLKVKDENGLVLLNKILSSYPPDKDNPQIIDINETIANFKSLTVYIVPFNDSKDFFVELLIEADQGSKPVIPIT